MNIYRFYVYAYLRQDGTPYYIGKGCDLRAYRKHIKIPVPEDKSRIVFYQTNILAEDALRLEIKYIKLFGRKDLGNGILRNMTDGGEGTIGYIFSEEHKQNMKGRTGPKGPTGPNKNPCVTRHNPRPYRTGIHYKKQIK